MTSTYHAATRSVVADNPLESVEFACPAEQRAPTREDRETTRALAELCRDAVELIRQQRR